VVPVGTGLLNLEVIDEGLAGSDTLEAHSRHAIHLKGHEHAVPVDRRRTVHPVGHTNRHRVALLPAQRWPWNRSVDRRRDPMFSGEIDRCLGHHQIEFATPQLRGRPGCGGRRLCARRPRGQPQHDAASSEPLHEAPPLNMDTFWPDEEIALHGFGCSCSMENRSRSLGRLHCHADDPTITLMSCSRQLAVDVLRLEFGNVSTAASRRLVGGDR